MNIGVVCYPTPGGSGVVATELGKCVAARGHEVHFITNGRPARLHEFYENVFLHNVDTGDYPVFQNYTPYSLSLAVKIREVAADHQLDLVHVHYAIPHAASAFLAKEMASPTPLPTVTTLHGTDITLVGLMPSFFEITKFSIKRSDAVTAVSEFLRQETVSRFDIDTPIDVIPNFVDTDLFRPNLDHPLRRRLAPNGERVIMHVSNFRKVKNLPTIVRVFAETRRQVPTRLVLVGDGPERGPTEHLARELGVCDDVVFLGGQEYVADVLPAADLFLLPSEHESFGLAGLEAMSCGVPVMGSRVGGLPEVIVHGETGYLCDPHDVDCMQRLVVGLFNDDAFRLEMGRKARARAVEAFGREAIVDRYVELYDRVAGGHRVAT